jgi:hypothetical protein
MITSPVQNTRLKSDRLEVDQHDSESFVGLVGFVGEQAMIASSDSEATAEIKENN